MTRSLAVWFSFVFLAPAVFPQTPPSDSDKLDLLLKEVRLLRQEMRASSAALTRAQVLAYRLQAQDAAVSSARQHADELRTRYVETQTSRKWLEARIKELDAQVNDLNTDVGARKGAEKILGLDRPKLETLLAQEQAQQAALTEADQLLSTEQQNQKALLEQLEDLENAGKNSGLK